MTTGKVHDAKVMDNLIREDDTAVYGDKGYANDQKKRAAAEAGVLWAVKEKAKPGRDLTKRQRARNRRFGKVRVFVNAENLLDVRQTRDEPIVLPARRPDGGWTVDAWAPLDGRVVNGGIRVVF